MELRFASALLLSGWIARAPFPQAEQDFPAAFEEIGRTVAEHFRDPELRGLDWDALVREFGARAGAARDLGGVRGGRERAARPSRHVPHALGEAIGSRSA